MAQTVLLQNARLIDGLANQPREKVSILVTGERITAVEQDDLTPPIGAQVIDLTGKTVVPGLIDTHVHTTSMEIHCVTRAICVSSSRSTAAAWRTTRRRFWRVRPSPMQFKRNYVKEVLCSCCTP
jgi:dihydroorotase-like cyclic amidohydrolase